MDRLLSILVSRADNRLFVLGEAFTPRHYRMHLKMVYADILMKHIVDNVNKLELTFKTIDLEGRVPSTDAIEFLSVEEPYREDRRYSPFVRVRYTLNGVKQDKAFPMDVDKGIFLSIDDDVLEEKLRTIAPKIVEILQEHAAQ